MARKNTKPRKKEDPYILPEGVSKALFLENQFWSDNIVGMREIHEFLTEQGIECKVIDRASNRIPEVIKEIQWCDAVFFASTFYYSSDVKSIGDLFQKVTTPKQIYGLPVTFTLKYWLNELFELKELAAMAHHKVFEITNYYIDLYESWFEELDMNQYKVTWEAQEEARILKNHSYKPTGRKVRIKDIVAYGGPSDQWGLLKKGDIVDELDCSEIDPDPSRGIWVMGRDEPVKILDERHAREYEIVK